VAAQGVEHEPRGGAPGGVQCPWLDGQEAKPHEAESCSAFGREKEGLICLFFWLFCMAKYYNFIIFLPGQKFWNNIRVIV